MQTPDYKFYPTLLDGFNYYLNSDSDEAFQNFIDRLNRKPFTSEAAAKGTAFNQVVDFLIPNPGVITSDNKYRLSGFEFKRDLCELFADKLRGAQTQFRCEAMIETTRGERVELYGFTDAILRDYVIDIKTTQYYNFPYYLSNFQHIVYPYCLRQMGIEVERFMYMVTDFNNYYEEEYLYDEEKDLPRLIEQIEMIIDFINTNRHLITDQKLFALV